MPTSRRDLPNWREIAEQCYRALKIRGGCNCPHEWVGGQYVAVATCQRCKAIAAHELAVLAESRAA